jgi:hypothetical protein
MTAQQDIQFQILASRPEFKFVDHVYRTGSTTGRDGTLISPESARSILELQYSIESKKPKFTGEEKYPEGMPGTARGTVRFRRRRATFASHAQAYLTAPALLDPRNDLLARYGLDHTRPTRETMFSSAQNYAMTQR